MDHETLQNYAGSAFEAQNVTGYRENFACLVFFCVLINYTIVPLEFGQGKPFQLLSMIILSFSIHEILYSANFRNTRFLFD